MRVCRVCGDSRIPIFGIAVAGLSVAGEVDLLLVVEAEEQGKDVLVYDLKVSAVSSPGTCEM